MTRTPFVALALVLSLAACGASEAATEATGVQSMSARVVETAVPATTTTAAGWHDTRNVADFEAMTRHNLATVDAERAIDAAKWLCAQMRTGKMPASDLRAGALDIAKSNHPGASAIAADEALYIWTGALRYCATR